MQFLSIVAITVPLVFVANVMSQEEASKQIRSAILEFEGSKESKSAGIALKRVLGFRSKAAEYLLSTNAGISVSLNFAWEFAHSKGGDLIGSDWFWFVGFLQGRTGLHIPVRWECCVCGQYYINAQELYSKVIKSCVPKTNALTLEKGFVAYHPLARKKIDDDLSVAANLELTKKEDGLTVGFGGESSVFLSSSLIDEAKKQLDKEIAISGILAGNKAIVAVYNRFGHGFPVFCINSISGEVIWKSGVWAMGTENLTDVSGPWFHEVFLEVTDNTLTVYGQGPACYFESFDLANGKPKYRFSTNNWFIK